MPALVKKRRMVRPEAFCFGVDGTAAAALVVVCWVWISAISLSCVPYLGANALKSQEKLARRRWNRRTSTSSPHCLIWRGGARSPRPGAPTLFLFYYLHLAVS